MAMRNSFVREESGTLIIGSGIVRHWLDGERSMSFGPAPTPWGDVTVGLESTPNEVVVNLSAGWRDSPPNIECRIPGFSPTPMSASAGQLQIDKSTRRPISQMEFV